MVMSHDSHKILLCLGFVNLDRSVGGQLFFGDNFLNEDTGDSKINSGIDGLSVLLLLKFSEFQPLLFFFQSLAFLPEIEIHSRPRLGNSPAEVRPSDRMASAPMPAPDSKMLQYPDFSSQGFYGKK
jgi:hypothetical protein